MARLVRATYALAVPRQMARTRRAMTMAEWRCVGLNDGWKNLRRFY